MRALVDEAVKVRLVSDVPLGAFLSGGLDSSAIVGLMARHLGAGVKTFSIGFRESSFNELEHARTVARHFATDHQEFVVEAKAASLLADLVWSLDEPLADPSALPTFILAGLAREHVTVVLTGDGGDEAFAGYDSYRAERWLAGYLRAPAPVRAGFERLLRNRKEDSSRTAIVRRAKRFIEKGHLPFDRREWRQIFPEAVKASLYQPEFAAEVGYRNSLDRRAAAFHVWRDVDPVTRLQLWDLTVYLPDDLMVKTDRTAMAHGLEARCPLLDHVVLEHAARIPSDLKVRGSDTKYIFKQAVSDLLPPSILARRKQGFGVPVSHWFRTELKELSRDVLLSDASVQRGYFRPDGVRRLIELHESGREDHGHQLWALVTLELWHQRFDHRLTTPGVDFAGCVAH